MILDLWYFALILFSIIAIIDFFMFIYIGINEAERLKQSLTIAFGFLFFCIIMVSIYMGITYFYPEIEPIIGGTTQVVVSSVALIILTYGMYLLVSIGKRKAQKSTANIEYFPKLGERQVSLVETLAKSRPAEITEEEVSISKEKKICLVCKGKLSRELYLCPNCDVLYCIKCSKALSNLENACWVCDAPFDESKPVKILEEDSEEVILKDDFRKK